MEIADHDITPPHRTVRMWSLYAVGWIAYLLLLALAIELDDLRAGRVDWRKLTHIYWNLPLALILALLWPVSGWIKRRRLSLQHATLVHAGGACVYAHIVLGLLVLEFGTQQPAGWFVWPVLYSTMAYALIAAIFHMVRMNRARQQQAAAIERAQALLVASELSALRSKLNPHFLFNTLHSIIALIRRDPVAAETALFQFSDMLRYVLDTEKNGNDRVTLDDEIAFVRDYLELEALRLGTRLQVSWDLDDLAGPRAMPALSLQPLVENSIKHAFNPHSRPGRLAIRTRIDPQSQALCVTVSDDGPGAAPDVVRTSQGLGIRTVERRLQLEYGERHGLAIDTAPGAGFRVTMTIPPA